MFSEEALTELLGEVGPHVGEEKICLFKGNCLRCIQLHVIYIIAAGVSSQNNNNNDNRMIFLPKPQRQIKVLQSEFVIDVGRESLGISRCVPDRATAPCSVAGPPFSRSCDPAHGLHAACP